MNHRELRHRAGAAPLVALALVACGASVAQAKPKSCPGKHWVGIWSASPTDASEGTSRSLAGQTSRTVLTPLGSGRRIRVRFTNVLSDEPLTIRRATVARSAGLSKTARGSRRSLRFSGRRSVTIPPGREEVSDRVHLRAWAAKRLAVSIYVDPSSDGIVTEHILGGQKSFIAEGDRTKHSGGAAFAETTLARLVVSGVDARLPRRAGAVATFGDSITDGFQGSGLGLAGNPPGIDEDVRYPDFLAGRLRQAGQRLPILNAGISGNRILEDGLVPSFGPSGLSRLHRDVLGLRGARTVIVLEGINDIGQTAATADRVIAGLSKLVARRERGGLRVLLGTLTPAGGTAIPTYGSPMAERIRSQVNAWIRAQDRSAGIVDFDEMVRDPADRSRLLPAYDSGDHLHPSTAGYQAMAAGVPLGKLRAHGCRR